MGSGRGGPGSRGRTGRETDFLNSTVVSYSSKITCNIQKHYFSNIEHAQLRNVSIPIAFSVGDREEDEVEGVC